MKKVIIVLLCITALLSLTLLAVWLNGYMERRTYRLDHKEAILDRSEEFGLDPYLVAAVIHCESSNRPDAVSPKGAVGLMQIMPDTGGWIAEKLAMDDFDAAMLQQADINIRLGCWYLSYLTERFSGVRQHVLAAYNAGPGNVSKWLEDPAYTRDGRLEEIPFAETREYVKRVEQAYEIYKRLYKNELG